MPQCIPTESIKKGDYMRLCNVGVNLRKTYSEGFQFKKRKGQGGFTLVELMVVVAVIAILASIAIPQFLSAGDKARDAKIQADVQTISNAAQLYMVDNSTDAVPSMEQLYKEGYLAEHVKTPKGGEYTITAEDNEGGKGRHIVVKAADEGN